MFIRYKLKRKQKRTYQDLKLLQSLPLETKVLYAQEKIKEWYEYWDGNVYVSFSGGKDSTVLLHLVRQIYPDVPAVFSDTGLEYPEIRDFVKTIDNVVWVKPKKNFKQIIEEYGYPVISKEQSQYIYEYNKTKSEYIKQYRFYGKNNTNTGKISEKWKFLITAPFPISHQCCYWLKKQPTAIFEKKTKLKAFLGILADESNMRKLTYVKYGCNSYETKRQISRPLSIFLENDVWDYINTNKISYAKIYNKGEKRTGCMFCMFGAHLEKEPNKFQRMQKIHPQIYSYCMNQLGLKKILKYLNIPFKNESKRSKLKRKITRKQLTRKE